MGTEAAREQATERPRVLVVQNQPGGGPRRLGEWLAEAGLRLDVVAAHDGAVLTDRLEHDAIVVLGGGFLPDDDARAPWLPRTRALVAEALRRQTPVLGVCLGGQLLAQVAGGTVTGDVGAPEAGSTPIRLRAEAADDPLLHDLGDVVPAIEHHVDAITALPPDAVWLAESDRCRYQALRVGPSAWGVQFHPEITADRIAGWDTAALTAQGFDPAALRRQATADEPVSTPVWHRVAQRFAHVVYQAGAAARMR